MGNKLALEINNPMINRTIRQLGRSPIFHMAIISFIGWYMLGSILIGIGVFFVNPYKEATMARLYNILSGNDGIEDKIILE